MSSKPSAIDDEEDVLQAVILADSFNKRFRPLTTKRPRCLLPICNAPLLDWTFEGLALAGVQEVFVLIRSHASLMKKAISDSKWSKPDSGMKIVPIMTAKETYSHGDAMRDIYTRGLVSSDFVLVMGDLVSNVRIDEVVKVHKERRKTNKDAIMTMVVKESGVRHPTRAQGESAVFVLDSQTSECLHYVHVQGHPRQKVVNIPREVLNGHSAIEIRNDLIDCSIDVCSVEVPSLFQDNFDYLDIRRDFVHGILTSDILMKNIHVYIAEEGYAARVRDTRSYEVISKDILSRWTFPLVPDDNHPAGHIYEHRRGNRYIAKDNSVVLARTANIGANTLIGSHSTISENVSIVSSVLGPSCSVGPGTTIRNAYIFENTSIGANCTIEKCIIGSGVSVKDGSVVPKGCLIGDRVIIGPGAQLTPFERLSSKRGANDANGDGDNQEEEEYDSDMEEVEASQDVIDKTPLGKESNAIVWPRGPPADDDEDEGPENWKNQRFMRIGDIDIVSEDDIESDEESESSASEDGFHDGASLSALSDVSSAALDIPGQAEAEFQAEVRQSLERAFAEGHSVDNAAVELKTLRMASNVPLRRVREAVVAAIVEKIPVLDGDMIGQKREIFGVVKRWGELIDKIGGVDAVETVSVLQEHCATSSRMPLFGQILAALYQADIVEEEDIRKWHSLPESKGEGRKPGVETENFQKCWVIGSHMIKQFDAQGSDSEEESESEVEEAEEEQEKSVDEEEGEEQEKSVDEKSEETTQDEDGESEGTTETGSEVETETESESEDEDTHPRRRNTIVASGPPPIVRATAAAGARAQQESTAEGSKPQTDNTPAPVEDSESEAESDSTDAGDAGVSASDESTTNTEDEESEDD